MRLFHERSLHRPNGDLGPGDEEECFTAVGRRQGIYLTTEELQGPTVVHCDVEDEAVAEFEVTGENAEHRLFVVPAAMTTDLHFV